MSSVIICDDSSMARKQMARTLPQDWDVEIGFAEGGAQCLDLIRAGKGDIVFLDLNMPEVDGYDVLSAIRQDDLPALVIVVSGDVQPEARVRVKKMGAVEFVKKPVDGDGLTSILRDYGLYSPSDKRQNPSIEQQHQQSDSASISWHDALRELSNVAMGQAGDLLARILDVFVHLPIPTVSEIDGSDLSMTIGHFRPNKNLEVVSQGFIGSGIAGEALVMLSEDDLSGMADLLGYDSGLESHRKTEVLTEMTSVLVGAFLKGLNQQLDIEFDLTHPNLLGCSDSVSEKLKGNAHSNSKLLTIEINYTINDQGMECDLLLVLAPQSLEPLRSRIQTVTD